MSRKQPEIKIVYPDASEAAMLLTEAMIKRSSGKRIVETTSEEKEYNGQELFAGALACKTDTSVELTLKLNPDATDYALATLIAKNLTEDEKRAIRMATTSMEVADILSTDNGTRAVQAAGQGPALEQSAARAAQPTEDATQSGGQKKIPTHQLYEADLRRIISTAMDDWKASRGDFFNILNTTIQDIKELAGEIRMQESELEAAKDFIMTAQLALVLALTSHCKHKKMRDQLQKATNELILDLGDHAYITTDDLRRAYLTIVGKDLELEDKDPGEIIADILAEDWSQGELIGESEPPTAPSWEDVANEARKIGMRVSIEPGDNTDDDIEPGLLNDIEDKTEGTDNG